MFSQRYGFDTFINSIPCLSMGLITEQRPNIPTAKEKITTYTLKGRDGSLYKHSGTYEDIKIKENFQFLTDSQNFIEKARKIRSFFRNAQTLAFSDDAEWFYKVKDITISEIGRNNQQGYGTFSVEYTVEPYAYNLNGTKKETIENFEEQTYTEESTDFIYAKQVAEKELLNSYDNAYPVIEIQTAGTYEITLNRKKIRFTNSYPAIFDTSIGLIYETTGDEMTNIKTTGDSLESFVLVSGKNSIKIEREQLTEQQNESPIIKIQPNWRCLN